MPPRRRLAEFGAGLWDELRLRLKSPVWRALGAILAAAAAVSTVIAVVVQLRSDSSSCSREGALLSRPLVQPSTLRNFLERTNASTEGLDEKRLNTPINEISVSVAIDGYKRKQLTLKWSMLDRSKAVIGERDRSVLVIQPSTCSTRLRPTFRAPAGSRPVIADILLEEADTEAGSILDEVQTKPFLASPA